MLAKHLINVKNEVYMNISNCLILKNIVFANLLLGDVKNTLNYNINSVLHMLKIKFIL